MPCVWTAWKPRLTSWGGGPGPRTWCKLWVLHTDSNARNNAFIALKTFLEAWREPGGPLSPFSPRQCHTLLPVPPGSLALKWRICPSPFWRDCEGHLGEAGVGGVRAQGAEGVNFCLGWKVREGVATSPPENILSQRRYCGVSSKVRVQGRVAPPQAPTTGPWN